MHNALVVVVAKRLRERGSERAGWLRLNYRGVGKSEGRYGAGKAEVNDVRAAIAEVRRRLPSAKVSVVGIFVRHRRGVPRCGSRRAGSSGSRSSRRLRACSRKESASSSARCRFVAAENDEFCTPEETQELTRQLGADAAGHSRAPTTSSFAIRREVAGLVVPFVAPELSP